MQLPVSSPSTSLYKQQGLIYPFIPHGNTNIDAFRIIELRWYYQTEFLPSLVEFKIFYLFKVWFKGLFDKTGSVSMLKPTIYPKFDKLNNRIEMGTNGEEKHILS
ncbi:MAG TPA: hypothetical protein DCQ58_09825 [Saprospirales bacterium]|nr:hypothetical protein [Saprospirales bacterium]